MDDEYMKNRGYTDESLEKELKAGKEGAQAKADEEA